MYLSTKDSSSSPKRKPLPEPDKPTYNNNMESAEYQVVGQSAAEIESYRQPSIDEIVKIKQRQERSGGTKCSLGYALIFALSIATSIGATAFLTYTFLKVNYHECLKIDDLPKLIQSQVLRPPRDCREHYEYGALVDGIYRVYPEKTTSVHVYCDMKKGGWTVIQRRTNGREDFDRNWIDYVEGFGNLSSDHWMGLKYQHLLTEHENQYQISFEFLLTNNFDTNSLATAVYDSFHVDSAETNFTMRVSLRAEYNRKMTEHVDQRNIFFYHDGMQFTTKDADHDERDTGSCVDRTKCGGFWYKNCHMICLNGQFDRMYFFEPANMQTYFSTSVVKIRPFT